MKSSKKFFNKVAVGGTFDHFHTGHQSLLTKAFSVSKHLIIGITNQQFVQDKHLAELIQPVSERERLVRAFTQNHFEGSFEIIKLNDPYGITISDPELEALVVSPQTFAVGGAINEIRKQKNLDELAIISAEMIADEEGEYISSTRIRKGVVSGKGERYEAIFTNDYILTEKQKDELKHPMGRLCSPKEIRDVVKKLQPFQTAVVGDASISTLIDLQIPFNYGVFDEQTQRHPALPFSRNETITLFEAVNLPGQISSKAVKVLQEMLHQEYGFLKVEGEEDLLVLPLLLLMPLDSLILYGQPNLGIVVVDTSVENKKRWYEFLKE